MIDEILKDIKSKKRRMEQTFEKLNEPSEGYIRQYKGQIHELNYFIELIEKTRLKYERRTKQ